jgi:homogentisate 1,2-dioxygenase
MSDSLKYLHGFQNHVETEAEINALISTRNSPQKVPYNLYAEQLNGTAFTVSRHQNLFSWLYRIRPSVVHGEFKHYAQDKLLPPPASADYTPPTQMRWDPMPYPENPCDFIDSLTTFAGNGSIESLTGAAIHLYCATASMQDKYFYNSDGDFLIVPQEGDLLFKTEMGKLHVTPGEIIVIPRGIKFQVELSGSKARGYVLENFGAPFRLPDLGVIGANGLANPRDFKSPVAAYENKEGNFSLVNKFQGKLWSASIHHSPLDVVAWHGNYSPYKYDLHLFNTINTVSFDHPDPSIFTVLTSPSASPGVANIDFVIFPSRWMVANDTFRPPYFHRNIMSEYMGIVKGKYDAKQTGFLPGGGSLHNCMTAHGPDAEAYQNAVNTSLKPEFYEDTLAFMFECRQVWRLTESAYESPHRQKNYLSCWSSLKSNFKLQLPVT